MEPPVSGGLWAGPARPELSGQYWSLLRLGTLPSNGGLPLLIAVDWKGIHKALQKQMTWRGHVPASGPTGLALNLDAVSKVPP